MTRRQLLKCCQPAPPLTAVASDRRQHSRPGVRRCSRRFPAPLRHGRRTATPPPSRGHRNPVRDPEETRPAPALVYSAPRSGSGERDCARGGAARRRRSRSSASEDSAPVRRRGTRKDKEVTRLRHLRRHMLVVSPLLPRGSDSEAAGPQVGPAPGPLPPFTGRGDPRGPCLRGCVLSISRTERYREQF